MVMSTDVNLPRDHQASFFEDCVRCGWDSGGNRVTLMTHTIGWLTWLLWTFGKVVRVDVPACRRCAWKIRLGRWWSAAAFVVAVCLVLHFVWPHVDDVVAPPFRRWARIGLVLLCLSPWFLASVLFPPPIDITAYQQSIDYEFANADDAYRFAALNTDAPWVKVDGTDLHTEESYDA